MVVTFWSFLMQLMKMTTHMVFGYSIFLAASSTVLFAQAQRTDPSEVNTLKVIRGRIIDPMNNLKSWNGGEPCTSNWTGIFCSKVASDGYLHITELQLLKLNLSGSLAPELGLLSHLQIMDFMWNKINGSIPKEIGNIKSLRLLLLSGNSISGILPEEIGYLTNLDRLQIDQNQIYGQIPKSFANLSSVQHLHMNNNSLSGQIPAELSTLPNLLHLLVDNNNLSGYLPPEFSTAPSLKILQLDNNNLNGSSIPASYGNMKTLMKLSLRNCSLQGDIFDFSGIPQLSYLDLSWNQLNGPLPLGELSINVTTIDLSNNFLVGMIPSSFSRLPKLQLLSFQNNSLNGSVPSSIWQNMSFGINGSLILNFQSNNLTDISDSYDPPANVSVWLYGNPVCESVTKPNMARLCRPMFINQPSGSSASYNLNCHPCPTDRDYEYNPLSPIPCLCSIPVGVGFRLKSPGISDFRPYLNDFEIDLSSLLNLSVYQVYVGLYTWESGPRLNMHLKLFPDNASIFDIKEVLQLRDILTAWDITLSDVFGPYELLNFTLGSYGNDISDTSELGLSKGALVGIVLGIIVGVATLSVLITTFIMRRHSGRQVTSRRHESSRTPIKVDGVKSFTFHEMSRAANKFSDATQVGQGAYGKVYKGTLLDGTVVAIKRAQAGSLQGLKEFVTEIELLSRVHHKNLVSLVGYCDEQDEQMLVYEFIPNGTLRDHLSAKSKESLSFSARLHIALGSARGILYLHTEANPPIFHRDIKASNILLDSKLVAKVADFGLSRLAPIPDVEGNEPDHVSTMVKGTPGYLDPEYFLTHKLTDRSDVYSLGVVLLELLTGMKPILHGKNIVREVKVACQSEQLSSIIDNRMGSYPPECAEKFASLALRCCRDYMDDRPSMAEVVRELETIVRMTPGDSSGSLATESGKLLQTPFLSSDVSISEPNAADTEVEILTPR